MKLLVITKDRASAFAWREEAYNQEVANQCRVIDFQALAIRYCEAYPSMSEMNTLPIAQPFTRLLTYKMTSEILIATYSGIFDPDEGCWTEDEEQAIICLKNILRAEYGLPVKKKRGR